MSDTGKVMVITGTDIEPDSAPWSVVVGMATGMANAMGGRIEHYLGYEDQEPNLEGEIYQARHHFWKVVRA
jgi:hypothetical protein